MKIFSKLHDEGKTIIMVTHEKSISDFSDRIIHVKDGNIIQ
jgi:putative ABC transport system ATP-binding protein